ncbi:unnamed protein product [Victoria cruziana]
MKNVVSASSKSVLPFLLCLLLLRSSTAQLTPDFYCDSCPNLMDIVRYQIQCAVEQEKRMGASLLRLFFHDCFVNGCDGSVLLDDTATTAGEKNALPNKNSLRGFEVIDAIKAAVEAACPGVVSCADIVALAARDSVVELGGPTWDVKLGRRDSRTASQAAANADLPAPSSSLDQLINSFNKVGLSVQDMVALSGAHTIGQARCVNFRSHIYNDSNIDNSVASSLQQVCPSKVGSGDNNLAPLDIQTPTDFDNAYYTNLLSAAGVLHSDQALYNGGITDAQVQAYSDDADTFFADFVAGMINMGDIKPLTGTDGEIRLNCRVANS